MDSMTYGNCQSLNLKYISDCREPMVSGSTGVLEPVENYVSTNYKSNGFTAFNLLPGKTKFTLSSKTYTSIRITSFLIATKEICANGQAMKVDVEYCYLDQVVSAIAHNH